MTWLAAAPLAVAGAVALAVSWASLVAPLYASALGIAIGIALWRSHRLAAIVCLAAGLRPLFPDPSWPALPSLRVPLAEPVLRAMPEPDASVAAGALLGGRGLVPRDVAEAFTRTGTAHLLAASGFNITLAANALGIALRPAGARVAAAGTVATAVAFALVAGMAASVARAALMVSASALGVLVGRRAAALNALGAAVCAILIAAPGSSADVGFLLSAAATLGLVLASAPLATRLVGPGWLRAELATTLAASGATLPIVALAFGRVSLVAPLANLVAAPLVAPLMAATGLVVLTAPLEPVSRAVALGAYLIARTLRLAIEAASALPLASVEFRAVGR